MAEPPLPADTKRDTILKKSLGHLLTKAKQRKKRKRNKNMKGSHVEITNKMSGGAAYHLVPGDLDTSGSEQDDSEENSRSLCTFTEGLEDPVTVCEEQLHGDGESLEEAAVVSREMFPVTVSEVLMTSNSASKNELPVESDSSLLIDLRSFPTENLTKNAFDGEETNQRHKDHLCRSSFLKTSNDKNSTWETGGVFEDYNLPPLSTEDKLGSYQVTSEPDVETELLSLNGKEEEISQCFNSDMHYKVPGNNPEDTVALKAEEKSSNARDFFSINLPAEKLQLGFDAQILLPSWSEDKFLGDQRPQKMRKPEQTHTNNSTQLNCCWSSEGLVKETQQVAVTEEADNAISNGLLTSPVGDVHFNSLVEARPTFIQHLSGVNVPGNDAAPITLKRKRHRRIVNLAPKFNLPRQIAGSTEGGKEVPIEDYVSKKSLSEVGQKGFLNKDCGEECEQNNALQEYFAPYSGMEVTCSLPTPHADALLHGISCIHLGQSSPMPKYSCRVCVSSRTKEEQARTLKQQQVVDKKEGESEKVSSEVTNSQAGVSSSVKVVSELPEDSSILASCGENVHEADGPEPAEASQLEDSHDANMKCSFLELPLSLGFAFQLVQLFGSPGLPLESLLPDDYIVPLDWKVSKMIYLLWKTSVEEKQKTNRLQNENTLADDNSLEDLTKNRQEKQDSSETLPEVELFHELIEENLMTYTSPGCLDAASHQL